MVFTQFSIRNRDSPDVDGSRSPFVRIGLHLGREHPFWVFITGLKWSAVSN